MFSIKNFFLSMTKWLVIACVALGTLSSLCFALTWLLLLIAPEFTAPVTCWLGSAVLVTMNASTAFMAMSWGTGLITGAFALLEGLVSLCRGRVEKPPKALDVRQIKNDNLQEAPTQYGFLFKQKQPCVEPGNGVDEQTIYHESTSGMRFN